MTAALRMRHAHETRARARPTTTPQGAAQCGTAPQGAAGHRVERRVPGPPTTRGHTGEQIVYARTVYCTRCAQTARAVLILNGLHCADAAAPRIVQPLGV